MPGFQVSATPAAARDFDRLPPSAAARFRAAFDHLRKDPWTPRPGCHVEPLEGIPRARKLRIGVYRGIYEVQGTDVVFTRFGHRSKVYR
ncbi:MAG TPA: type II toxin-antitoxin system RelE/ParE family toxin [Candidatus Thermoplasmatota archaeon]|nr:type II toxin-antitoxin system RelE/ParE family toxin [Candidatus Thermoplasmatota archaeon]